jgi:hypothetical protein
MKVYVDDIPDSLTLMAYIRKTDWWKAALEKVSNYKYDDFIAEVSMDKINRLETTLRELSKTIPFKSWISKEGKPSSYLGASLTYNPNHVEDIDINYSTLGSRLNSSNEFYWNTLKNHKVLKNSYFDTYGFRKLTPYGKAVSEVMPIDNMPHGITIVRSRIGVIDASVPQTRNFHKDEIIYENLRLNVPVWSESDSFVFQREEEEPYRLEVGKCYSWDTNISHGVYSTEVLNATRCNLVLGFSPWLKYDESDNSWSTNDMFGTPAHEVIREIYKGLNLG